jgi:uracil-DNA glycosylase family 4
MIVANRFPTQLCQYRIALISEAPGRDEAQNGQPLCGASGRFLAALLSRAGVSREACFLGHVIQTPMHAGITTWNNDAVQEGLYQLKKDLDVFKPNIVVLLGNIPLKAAKAPLTDAGIVKKFQFSAAKWRGSLFNGEPGGPFENLKCLSTYHPAYCLRDYDSTPMLQFDLRKAVREGSSPILNSPKRIFETNLTNEQQCQKLQELRKTKSSVAIDIEGGIDTMSCISFAPNTNSAFIIPIYNKAGDVLITPKVWRELALTLEDENLPKILQNSLYDRFVLHYSYGIRVRGVLHDTMLKHWELYSELEKSLGVQASIYTDEPYYKGDRKSNDDKTFYEYCCRDSAITLEISNKLDSLVRGISKQHYELNMGLLNPVLYMELRGIRYDIIGAHNRRQELLDQLHAAQARLNALTGHGFDFKSLNNIRNHANQIFYTKKGDRPRKEHIGSVCRFRELLAQSNPVLATMGELEDLCEVSLNVSSGKQFMGYLYDTLKLPTQMSNVRGEEPHPTADYEALLNLSRWCTQNKHVQGFAVCQAAIEIRALQTRQQMLSISADKDGRIRCGYNIVGSNTGRITCYASPTGSGYNLQTIPNYTNTKDAPGGVLGDRDLFLADPGYYIFQCDLSGADGWTVAAYSAMLGDSTMLDDYRAGIKPAKVIALAMRGLPVPSDRQELYEACKVIKKDDWEYFAGKRVQHGGAYLEGGLTISRNCLKDSEGKLVLAPKECDNLKNKIYFGRYWGIPKWHEWIARRLKERPILIAASGQVRQFFGRPDDTITKAVAFEPQANTTYATNLAAWRLWTDKENRNSSSNASSVIKLRIEPLHQVHDALLGQFRIEDTAWAAVKVKSYFNNPLVIAGQQITIPYEGGYGHSWGGKNVGAL